MWSIVCRVYLADDLPELRLIWRIVLEDDSEIEIVGEAADGRAALEGVEATDPDVLVLDLSMPDMSGLEVLKVLRDRESRPRPRIIVASGHLASRMEDLVLSMGATAYFEKGRDSAGLRAMVIAACGCKEVSA